MNINWKNNVSRGLIFSLALLASAASSAWHGGGYHGGSYGYHGGGYHGAYGYHGGYYGRGYGWGGWGNGVVVGAPLIGYYGANYYGCRNVRVCNAYNHCWVHHECN